MYPWKQLVSASQRCMITTPDCSLLHYELALKIYPKSTQIRSKLNKDPQIKNLDALYNQSLFRENEIAYSKSIIHVVGVEDLKRYNTINPNKTDVFFSPHPISDFKKKSNYFQNNKISVLISGTNHSIYNGDYIDKVIKVILKNSKELSEKISITFLGKNFEENITALIAENFDVEHLRWVDSYEDEIIKHDIHLFALQLGTGTKGKVLCSMASGLICVGNKYAFENIIVDDDLLINFKNENDFLDILKNIDKNKKYYIKNALKIQKQVIKNHSSERSAKIFWNKLKEFI
jgi:glycosyltransferase involved in cell wall biosynthesis